MDAAGSSVRDRRRRRSVGRIYADALQYVCHDHRRRPSDAAAGAHGDFSADGYASTGNSYPCTNGDASTGDRYTRTNGDGHTHGDRYHSANGNGHTHGDAQPANRYSQANSYARAGDRYSCTNGDGHTHGYTQPANRYSQANSYGYGQTNGYRHGYEHARAANRYHSANGDSYADGRCGDPGACDSVGRAGSRRGRGEHGLDHRLGSRAGDCGGGSCLVFTRRYGLGGIGE